VATHAVRHTDPDTRVASDTRIVVLSFLSNIRIPPDTRGTFCLFFVVDTRLPLHMTYPSNPTHGSLPTHGELLLLLGDPLDKPSRHTGHCSSTARRPHSTSLRRHTAGIFLFIVVNGDSRLIGNTCRHRQHMPEFFCSFIVW